MRALIYERLLAYCEHYPAPGTWRRMDQGADCYHCPRNAAQVLHVLSWEFFRSDLVDAAIAHGGREGIRISPALTDPGGILVVLRSAPGAHEPCAILTATGPLHAEAPSFVGTLGAIQELELSCASDRRIFLVSSLDDLVALRSVGLVAVMPNGILDCDDAQFQELCERCEWHDSPDNDFIAPDPAEPKDDTAAEGEDAPAESSAALDSDIADEEPSNIGQPQPFQRQAIVLVIVDWSPASLSGMSPVDLQPIVDFLARAQRFLELDMTNVAIWRPDAQTLEKLGFLLERGSRQQVRAALLESVDDSSRSLDAAPLDESADTAPGDFAASAATITQLLRDDPQQQMHPERWNKVLASHDDVVERTLIAPMIAEAMQADTAFNRTKLLAVATLSRLLHQHAPLVQRALAGTSANVRDAQFHDLLRDHLTIVAQLFALVREARR